MNEVILKSFPKIFHLGHRTISNIFDYEVEVTEKVDGSQFVFGWDDAGNYHCRSKGTTIDVNNVPNLFQPVVEWSKSLASVRGFSFYGETLCKPKHNTLAYERTPLNNFVLFGVATFDGMEHIHDHSRLLEWATELNCDVIPLLYKGKTDVKTVMGMVGNCTSYLGKENIEGVVVKADVQYEMYGQHVPLMCGKFVTEQFKEKHSTNPEYISGKSKIEDLMQEYTTSARWVKAVNKLREADEWLGEPKDIGNLFKLVQQDFEEECADEIKDRLWNIYRKDFIKSSTNGMPEWYKRALANGEFE